MKKIYIAAAVAALPALMSAQSAFDAFQISQTELRGSARFMSMAGAFGALGGDISTLTQNPAGIGVYTGSEVGASVEFDFQRTGFKSGSFSFTEKQTSTSFNNFGYVGSTYTGGSVMPFFSWGVSYNRLQSFDRRYRGAIPTMNTSMSNYIASFSGRYALNELIGTDDYDPFASPSGLPYLSILGANAGLIVPAEDGGYVGLWGQGSIGDATTWTKQSGHIDEYAIDFGGNFADIVYWGIGFGINDISFTSETYYDESIGGAYIPTHRYLDQIAYGGAPSDYRGEYNIGAADWNLQNYQAVSGTGFNMKFGLIIKPVNEFRIGLAVHTPTWYKLTYGTNAWVGYDLISSDDHGDYGYKGNETTNPYATSEYGEWNAKIRSPWRFIGSLAGVIDRRFIISADYQYDAYPSMKITMPDDGTMQSIMDNQVLEAAAVRDIKHYYKPTSTIRLGAEYRINRHFSARLGYSYKTSPSTTQALTGKTYFYTSGTQTITELQDVTQLYTAGLGYRYNSFYLDLAYVHQTRDSHWQAFSSFPCISGNDGYEVPVGAPAPPRAKVSDTRNQLVLSLGFKF